MCWSDALIPLFWSLPAPFPSSWVTSSPGSGGGAPALLGSLAVLKPNLRLGCKWGTTGHPGGLPSPRDLELKLPWGGRVPVLGVRGGVGGKVGLGAPGVS